MNSNSSSRCRGLWRNIDSEREKSKVEKLKTGGTAKIALGKRLPSQTSKARSSHFNFSTLQLFLFAAFSLLSCGKDEFSLQHLRELPAPTTDDLTAVWFTGPQTGYLTGGQIWERGFVRRTTDGGETWTTDTTTANLLENIHFDPTGQGYACGPDGLLLTKSPTEKHWRPARQDWTWDRACFFLNPSLGLVVGGNGWREGRIRRLAPEIWEIDTTFDCPNELDAVWFSDSTTAHAVGQGWVLRSSDAGRTWLRAEVPSDFYHAVHFPTADVGYACAENGTILKTTDAGRTWQTLRSGNSIWVKDRPMRSVWFVSAEKGYIVGGNGLFWRTQNGGSDWEQVADLPGDPDFTDIFVLGNKGWATARSGRVFTFED